MLQAGCLAPLRELAIGELTEGGFEISVTAVDADQPLARRVLRDTQSAYDDVITGDLRTVPIPQRAYDVVYCALLLERVQHVELVLDRLTSALKPGGLLLRADRGPVQRDGPARPAAAPDDPQGRLVQVPPRHPRPVPPGLREGGLRRGHRLLRPDARTRHRRARQRPDAVPTRPAGLSSSVRITCAAISRLSGGRFDDSHDELLYVIRKPLDRFARVV